MGEWIKSKRIKRGFYFVIGMIIPKIVDGIIDFSGKLSLPAILTMSISDILLIMGLIVLVILIVIILLDGKGLLPTKKMKEIKKIDGVKAYLFFPVETPEENWNLDYHSKHLQKRLIVNLNVHPPKAYSLTVSKDSYGWQLIKKYSRMWEYELHSGLKEDEYFTKKWCKTKGYTLIERVASKDDLLDKN